MLVAEHVQNCHAEKGPRAESEATPRITPRPAFESPIPAFLKPKSDPCRKHPSFRFRALGVTEFVQSTTSEQPPFRSPPRSEHIGDEVQTHKPSGQPLSYSDSERSPYFWTRPSKTPNESIERLGRAELGPYAHEKKMPSWLLRMLDKGNTTKLKRITSEGRLSKHVIVENQSVNAISALAHLCGRDKSIQRAFLCSAHVHQISKLPREGYFCGYRNIQMLVSYLQESHSPGSDHFSDALPTILQLQDMIENAWDVGFNSGGRTETGGIKGTRKYIGTSEAQALFLSLGIGCEASSIGKTNEMPAYSALLTGVAAYFKSACPLNKTGKVVLTNLPPIYFQHHGHSMTIVGFEIREKGCANLLVFDPARRIPSAIKHPATHSIKTSEPGRILKGYRRGVAYLKKYQTFELLKYMRSSPNIIITGTPGVGKTVHCEQLARDTGLRHLSINQVAKDRNCYDTYDEELKTWVVDEDKLLDAIEDEMLQGGYLIDWHACDLFPKSWVDLVVVLRCPSTSVLYDRLNSRGYHETKLQENLDAEIFAVLLEEAREAFDEEIVVELNSEEDDDVENNCARVSSWVENWKSDQAKFSD
ncbi:DUF1671-domain-containing protein [Aspergillus lucknowensis]|uniref:Adenylate kinase isoenzyme 6 homolog n=1 Tax=Aspergillus lucknowensis TaxID=176173 RepID=A0ABR4LP60_9EURO